MLSINSYLVLHEFKLSINSSVFFLNQQLNLLLHVWWKPVALFFEVLLHNLSIYLGRFGSKLQFFLKLIDNLHELRLKQLEIILSVWCKLVNLESDGLSKTFLVDDGLNVEERGLLLFPLLLHLPLKFEHVLEALLANGLHLLTLRLQTSDLLPLAFLLRLCSRLLIWF